MKLFFRGLSVVVRAVTHQHFSQVVLKLTGFFLMHLHNTDLKLRTHRSPLLLLIFRLISTNPLVIPCLIFVKSNICWTLPTISYLQWIFYEIIQTIFIDQFEYLLGFFEAYLTRDSGIGGSGGPTTLFLRLKSQRHFFIHLFLFIKNN